MAHVRHPGGRPRRGLTMIKLIARSAPSLAAAGAVLALLAGGPAYAASKVWVSNAGVDNGTCGSTTAPCKTFQQASLNVPAGGEIGVLSPGDYGSLSINHALNITNDGAGEASILVGAGVVGISIFAAAGDVISLRGLIIDGQINGSIGIGITSASAVHIQNCVIRNFQFSSSG